VEGGEAGELNFKKLKKKSFGIRGTYVHKWDWGKAWKNLQKK
jgi:hypothetical protein